MKKYVVYADGVGFLEETSDYVYPLFVHIVDAAKKFRDKREAIDAIDAIITEGKLDYKFLVLKIEDFNTTPIVK